MLTLKFKMEITRLSVEYGAISLALRSIEASGPGHEVHLVLPLERPQIAEVAIALSEGGEGAEITVELGQGES